MHGQNRQHSKWHLLKAMPWLLSYYQLRQHVLLSRFCGIDRGPYSKAVSLNYPIPTNVAFLRL